MWECQELETTWRRTDVTGAGHLKMLRDLPGEELVVERLELFPSELDGQVGVVKETLHLE